MTIQFVLCVVLAFAQTIQAQNGVSRPFERVKHWQFHSQHGNVSVQLIAFMHAFHPPMYNTISIDASEAVSPPSTEELAGFLQVVLQEMSSLGQDPHRLEAITIAIQESEYRDGIAQTIERSGKWKSCLREKYCNEAQPVVMQYLRAQNAFKQFDYILQQYGLSRDMVVSDELSVSVVSGIQSGHEGESSGSHHISCSGFITINVKPLKH